MRRILSVVASLALVATNTHAQVNQPGAPQTVGSATAQVNQGRPAVTLETLAAKVDAELNASKEHLQAVRDAAAVNNVIFGLLGALLSLFGIVGWLRQRKQDNYLEERLRESDRQRAEVHAHSLGIAANEEFRRQEVHRGSVSNMAQINELTTAVAAGARQNVETINKMFAAINSILEFKAQEAKDVQGGLAEIKK